MNLALLAYRSLVNRRSTAILTVVSIAISVTLLLGVEKIRINARDSFANTISGTDLIVGGRSGSVQLLLYSIFRIGNATNNISWESYQAITSKPGIKWTIPISLGDSHRGYRVMGTNQDYFEYYRHGNKRKLELAAGETFKDYFDVVIGAEVADALNYQVGEDVIVTHGISSSSITDHKDKPFHVSGILKPTGTPVDRTLHISLEGIEAMHLGWQNGVPIPNANTSVKRARKSQLQPKSITAFLLGLENKITAFKLQRFINEYPNESLLAIFPGVALHELWGLMSIAEKALLAISSFVVVAALIGMLAVSLAGLNERRREIAILRSVGAGYRHIIGLLVVESSLLTMAGIMTGLILLYSGLILAQPLIESSYGLHIPVTLPGLRELGMLSILAAAGILVGLIPAYRAYRNSLLDGMSSKT